MGTKERLLIEGANIRMVKTPAIVSGTFEYTGEGTVDERKRISIGKVLDSLKGLFGEETGLRFAIYKNELGQILLSPEISVPLHEAWLYKNPEALSAVTQGLADAADGEIFNLGSFEKHADDKIE